MLRDKLSPGTKPGFLKSEKMFRFKLLYIHKSVSENVSNFYISIKVYQKMFIHKHFLIHFYGYIKV